MTETLRIHQDLGLSVLTNAVDALASSGLNSGVISQVQVSDAGDQLSFAVDTLLDGLDFWVELSGADFSNDANDRDFSVSHVRVALTDATHDATAPLFYWQGDVDVTFANGEATQVQLVNYEWDASALQASIDSGLEKFKTRYKVFENWASLSDELWTRIGLNQGFYAETLNDSATLITRKYWLSSTETNSYNAIATVNIHGADLSTDRTDPEFRVDYVDGSVQFMSSQLGDDDTATFRLDLVQEVQNGWVTRLELNGGEFSFSGLTAWLDTRWNAQTKNFDFSFTSDSFSMRNLIESLGLDSWYSMLADQAVVNSAGTEIVLSASTAQDGADLSIVLRGQGFSNSLDDADFSLSSISMSLTDAKHPANDPLMVYERALNLSVVDGQWQGGQVEPTWVSRFTSVVRESTQHENVEFEIKLGDGVRFGQSKVYLARPRDDGSIEQIDLADDDWVLDGATNILKVSAALKYGSEYSVKVAGTLTDALGQSLSLDTLGSYTTGMVPDGVGIAAKVAHWRDAAIELSGVVTKAGAPTLAAPSTSDGAVTLTDVLGALKVYLNKPLPDDYKSPYNVVAADFDGDGGVDLTDVLSLLKYYLKKPVDAAPTWVFADADAPTDQLSRDDAHMQSLNPDFLDDSTVQLVGVLRGDVDGSWHPSA